MKRSLGILLLPVVLATVACDEDGTGPANLDFLIGTYVLNPAPQTTCNVSGFGNVTATIDTVEVVDVRGDSLDLRVPIALESSLFDDVYDAEFSVGVEGDEDSPTFSGSSVLDVDVPAGFSTVHGNGDFAIDGEFTGDDSFSADIESDFAVALGDGTPTPCTHIELAVVGTRD